MPDRYFKMTRINLIDPKELSDQHLMAEWREIKMVPAALRRSLKTKSIESILKSIPNNYTLGTGHVRFFYDKMIYLKNRYEILTKELLNRGYNLKNTETFDSYTKDLPKEFLLDYEPTENAIGIITSRISEKIAMKPGWYRYYGKKLDISKNCVNIGI